MSRRALLLLNPAARSSRRLLEPDGAPRPKLDELIGTLGGGGFECELVLTRAPGHAAELAREATSRGGLEAVFALGGDGILRETAMGLLGSEVPLALLPAGTANVLARMFELPLDAGRAAALYANAAERFVRRLDVGVVEPAEPDGEAPPISFLMMASGGLDARALERLPPAWKRLFGRTGVVLSGVRELGRGAEPAFEYRIDGAATRRATFLSACNIPLYGGRFLLAPDALTDDGLLDVVVSEGEGRAAALAFSLRVVAGRAPRTVRAAEVVLPGSDVATLQVDGDAVAVQLPARIALAEETLPVLLPKL